jgi:ectoine hydroxylase-related dioxygenase (phytanoyl-CoA dioxygenase family)
MATNRPLTSEFDATYRQELWTESANKEVAADRPLPTPTRDLTDLHADLDAHGYCLVADAVSPADRTALREKFERQWEAEARIGRGLPNPTGVHSICNLLVKGEIFQKTVLQPVVDELMEYLLGDGFLISAICGLQTVPGSKAQGLHTDQFLFGIPADFSLVANAFFMIDEFTEANGATRVVPSSHRWSPEQVASVYEGIGVAGDGVGENPAGSIPATAPAGTCMVLEGRLVHGAGKNLSADRTRLAISSYYCRPWLRPFTNAFLSTPDDIMASFSPALRAQLGYATWRLSGGYEAPGMPASVEVVRPSDQVRDLTNTSS